MKFDLLKIKELKNHKAYLFLTKNQKYAPLLFFAGGFLWDWLTLGRVDRLYDMILLSAYFCLLSFCIYFYNSTGHSIWQHKFLKTYQEYLPLAIQFFLGGLTSAYVIYFSRSVSLSKTASFFVILILLFFANEIFKKRISNIYLQFGIYSFVSYTFFAYMIPVLITKMNPIIFSASGIFSFLVTSGLIYFIYKTNTTIKHEVSKIQLFRLVCLVYAFITIFYFFKLIPPVPLALNKSIVAYNITKENNTYNITYEAENRFIFWREHTKQIGIKNADKIYVFTSVFAPTDLNKKVYHQWNRYNPDKQEWEVTDKIRFTIVGGRNTGFRGYTYKQNIAEGQWKVEVLTEEGLIIGIVDFELTNKVQNNYNTKSINL